MNEKPLEAGGDSRAASWHPGHTNAHDHHDEAMEAFAGLEGQAIVLDQPTNQRLFRRIDLILMPMLCIVYGLQYLDKTTLSYASIMGLQKDIGLVGNEYSWLGSVFYFGYLGVELPAARLLQSLPLAKYSAFCIIAWGITLCCFTAVRSYSGAVVVRFFLGVFEASVTPGFALFTSQWYTKGEQASRIAFWISFNGFAQIFGGAFAYGIARNNSQGYSLAPWRIVFLFTGLLTVVVGFIFLAVVPDNQLNAWWLTKRDRILAVERVRVNQQGIGNKYFKAYQLKEALTDPLTWAFVFFALVSDIPNGGLTNFFSQLIEFFGFTPQESLLYGMPGGVVEIVVLVSWGLITQRWGNRLLWSIAGLGLALLGGILIVALPLSNRVGRLVGYYLTNALPVAFAALLSLVSSNVAGYTKKTTVAALYLVGYCTGNIMGPQTFRSKDAPRYVPAEVVIVVCYAISMLDLGLIYWICRRQNTKKALFRAQSAYQKKENQEWLDLTDRENPEFIYEL